MATLATDPAFAPIVEHLAGSYQDNAGITRDVTINIDYSTNPDTSIKSALTKREFFAVTLLTGRIGSPSYQGVVTEELVYQAVKQADMLIATLNNTPIP